MNQPAMNYSTQLQDRVGLRRFSDPGHCLLSSLERVERVGDSIPHSGGAVVVQRGDGSEYASVLFRRPLFFPQGKERFRVSSG